MLETILTWMAAFVIGTMIPPLLAVEIGNRIRPARDPWLTRQHRINLIWLAVILVIVQSAGVMPGLELIPFLVLSTGLITAMEISIRRGPVTA